jgi:hypothetical protein
MLVHETRTTLEHAASGSPLFGATAAPLGGAPAGFTQPLKEAP